VDAKESLKSFVQSSDIASGWILKLSAPFWLVALGALAGCASASLRSARGEIAAGHYATAHQQLVAARNEPNLSSYHRREIDDDLCLTEQKIGAPGYPIAEQLSACERAADEGASRSEKILRQIQDGQREGLTKEIDGAIAAGDVARAEDGIARYRAGAGADPGRVATWSRQLWAVIDRDDAKAAKSRHAAIRPAIAQLARSYPRVHSMNDQAFFRWVEKNTTVAGTRMISGVEVSKHTLTLRLPDDQLRAAAINLDLFAKVNDAMVARCGCDGRTKVAIQSTQLPAYLVRLDPATGRSEVLVLARY
jgi:hypothetical protein